MAYEAVQLVCTLVHEEETECHGTWTVAVDSELLVAQSAGAGARSTQAAVAATHGTEVDLAHGTRAAGTVTDGTGADVVVAHGTGTAGNETRTEARGGGTAGAVAVGAHPLAAEIAGGVGADVRLTETHGVEVAGAEAHGYGTAGAVAVGAQPHAAEIAGGVGADLRLTETHGVEAAGAEARGD